MVAGMAAPAYADVYYIGDGNITITKDESGTYVKHSGNDTATKDNDGKIVIKGGKRSEDTPAPGGGSSEGTTPAKSPAKSMSATPPSEDSENNDMVYLGDTKGSGADLTLGSGTYIDNFEDQIVGHTPGETFDVTVTFPEDYGNADLNGKEAVFETTLNYIKESVTPELTDDWVKENLGESMSLNSVDELKAFVKSTMLYDNQASDVYTALHDKASYADELPQTALDYYRDVLLYRIYTNAQKYGTNMNTLLSSGMMGSSYDSVDAYLADANDSIKSITQQALLMQAVAEKTGFKCDTATMSADFGRYSGTTDPSQYVSAYGENYIKMNVLQSDVMQSLIDNVKYE